MIIIPADTKKALMALSGRFVTDNAERIEKLCRIWNSSPTSLLEWVLKEGLEQLEAHTSMIMMHQEVSE